jgi:tetratricopeptide (TPR) repeat protein
MKHFTAAIRLNPTLAEARHNLAICLANHNQLDAAIDQWKEAVRYEPSDGMIRGWLAEALRLRGDRAGAIEQYRAAFAAGEHNPVWESDFAWLVATDPGAGDDELEEAVAQGRDAADRTNQNQAMGLDALGAALARVGRFDDAVDAAKRAATAAEAEGKGELVKEIRARLGAYRAGHVYLVHAPQSPASQ